VVAGPYELRASAQRQIFDGFLKIYHEEKEPDENGNGGNGAEQLPELEKDETVLLRDLTPTQSFTKPPARYSEAMLVKRMEADGIGRPSTYASIIATIKDRKYVILESRKLYPTDLGRAVNKILVENFPALFNVEFTANMEKDLDLIEEGTDDWVEVIRTFYTPFKESLDSLKDKTQDIKASLTEKTDIKCEKCGEPMVIKWGRNGRFLGCSAYPDCDSTRPLPEEEAQNKTDEVCDKCGAPMVVKTGRFGRFLACSAYPKCKNTKALTIGVKCPKEGCGGKLVEKKTRTGRIFYGCSKYPKCDFASWDKPVATACPACGNEYMLQKRSNAKGDYLKCPSCKHEITEPTNEPNPVS